MKIKLIINPKAGIQQRNIDSLKKKVFHKTQKNYEDIIINYFEKTNHILDIERTKKKGDGTKIAKKSQKYEIIIVAGGDGTLNEVINGLDKFKGKLGIIPTGSTNVVAKELKIPFSINKACKIIKTEKTTKVDIGVINNKKFIFVAGIGFDAYAINNVEPKLKELIGRHSYTVAGLKTLFEHKPEELTIKIGTKKETGYFVLVSNTKRYGGNIKITPEAEINDGFLDMCIFQKKDIWSVMKYVIGATKGSITKIKGIKHYKIKKANITTKNKKVLFHTDAEIGGTTPIKINVFPRNLNIIIP